jgi:membrane-bound ClpP family serine protease
MGAGILAIFGGPIFFEGQGDLPVEAWNLTFIGLFGLIGFSTFLIGFHWLVQQRPVDEWLIGLLTLMVTLLLVVYVFGIYMQNHPSMYNGNEMLKRVLDDFTLADAS